MSEKIDPEVSIDRSIDPAPADQNFELPSNLESPSNLKSPASLESPAGRVFGLRRFAYGLLAAFFFVLGLLGAFLPGLPSTPFFLLMSYFLIRVSPQLNERVMRWPVVGKTLRNWNEKQAVSRGVKTLAYSMVCIFVGCTLIFSSLGIYIKVTIFFLALIGLYVVYRLPTLESDR